MVTRNLGDHNPSFRNSADTITIGPTLSLDNDPTLGSGAVGVTELATDAVINVKVDAAAAIAWSKMAALTDGQLLIGSGANVATDVALSGDATLANTGALTIANDAVTEAKTADSAGTGGLFVKKYALAVYDFGVDGGTEGTITLADTATIPDNAVVTAANYDVITTCTSSGDAATIKLNLPTDGDLSTAIAISDGTDPWDAGAHNASVITPLSVKTTGARAIQIVTAGGQDLTAGKIVFSVEYWVSQ